MRFVHIDLSILYLIDIEAHLSPDEMRKQK